MGTANVYALVALLASLCYVNTAVPTAAPPVNSPAFTPDGKVFIYKFSASVAAGQSEPAPFASKFQLRGRLLYASNPASIELRYRDVEYAIYNGRDDGNKVQGKFHLLNLEDFYKPFAIVYDSKHQFSGVKLDSHEIQWSKDVKKALASTFHVAYSGEAAGASYHRDEDTVYGKCKVDYLVYADEANETIVEKGYEPRTCGHYVKLVVSDSKDEHCDVQAEEDLTTVNRKVYTYGKVAGVDGNVIKKVSSHETQSYLPWSHRNYGMQFIQSNQTFEFDRIADKSEFYTSSGDGLQESVLVGRDNHDYELSGLDSKVLISKVKNLLVEMVDFLKENRIDETSFEHDYLLQDLYQYLKYMDKESLHYVFRHFTVSDKGNMTRKVFLRTIPHVGTPAVWNFVLNVTTDDNEALRMDDETRLSLIRALPLYVVTPTLEFARKMSEFASLSGGYHVKGAGILTYSILMNKVMKANGLKELPEEFQKTVHEFYDRIRYENTYKNKILYMMALRNIGVGIHKFLAPIVKGEDVFYVDVMIEKREKYRTAAMWAVAESISRDYDATYDLFWPILANSSLPLSMRITAYELLVPRNPMLDTRILMRVHEMMESEKDEHLFNYHYTTLKSSAEATSPCRQMHAELMRKVLHVTKPRRVLSAALSMVNVYDYYDAVYGHGKNVRMAAEVNEATGIPQTGYYEVASTVARRPKGSSGYYWNIDGINMNTVTELAKNVINPSAHIPTEITDEKIRKILEQTQGHKLFERHVHVEFWKVDKGYVTDVQVYFENALTDLLRELVECYKPDFDQLMDVGEKYNIDAMDFSFANRYAMYVTTDFGLPAYFVNDVPHVAYAKLKPQLYPQKNIAMRLEFDARYHRSSVYAMRLYNPILDVTHGVERRVVVDGALPVDVTFSLQMPSQALKLELPRFAKQAAGLKIRSVDQVVVGRDEVKNHLKAHCATCENRTDITNGPMHKKTDLRVMHHLDSGLEFSYGIFDCEHEFEPNVEMQEWYRIFRSPKNSWRQDVFVNLWMIVDQGMMNYVNNPYTSSCGVILKAAPSTMYPVSRVEMNWRASAAKIGNEAKLVLRGIVDVKSAKSNDTMRNWEIDLSTELSKYLVAFGAKLTRKTPDEKNLKVCFEAVKAYPKLVADVSKMEYETHSKVTFKMGHNDGDECPADVMDVKADVVGERLEEQIEEMRSYVKPGSCFRNASNPLDLDVTKPFDWNCLYQAVKSSTMRKYTVDVSYGEMASEYSAKLQMIEDWVRSLSWPEISYRPERTEQGHAKIYVSYPASKIYGNITFVTPRYTWELIDVIYEEDEAEKRQNDLVFDNTVFSTNFLVDFYKDDVRPCIAHAHDLINDMNHTIPMEFKDWTLMSGDHGLMSYAVFVKAIADDKVAVRIYVPEHVLEVSPGEAKSVVTLDGAVVPYDDEEISLPAFDSTNYKITTVNKLIVVETEKYSKVKVYYTPYNVIVLPHIVLDRTVDGVCGHMGTTVYAQQAPLVLGSA